VNNKEDSNKVNNIITSEKGTRSTRYRFGVRFVGILLGAVFLFIAINYANEWRERRAIDKLAEGLERYEREMYEGAMADTTGGTTPQETLSLYIDAVEKGNYELASQYFVESRREAELESLRFSNSSDIQRVLELLKRVEKIDDDVFGTKVDGFDFLVIFVKYPNGIWKITEI
jgi:hypothetical protein